MRKWQIAALWLVLIVALSWWKYGGGSLDQPADPFDERALLRQILPQGRESVLRHFTLQKLGPGWAYYRPVAVLSIYLDHRISGRPQMEPDGSISDDTFDTPGVAFQYHLTDLLLHMLASVAFGMVMWRVCRRGWVGMGAGLLYAVSPTNQHIVPWYAARYDSLCTPLLFLAAYCYLRYMQAAARSGTGKYLVGMLAFFTLALGSKENAVALPLLLAVWTLLLLPRATWRRALLPLAASVVLVALFLAARHHALGFFMPADVAAMASRPRFFTLPARFLLFPLTRLWGFLVSYGPQPWAWLDLPVWQELLAEVAFWWTAVMLLRRQWRRAVAFYAWMIIFYLPIAYIYAFNVFPHYLALPSAGAVMLGVLATWQWKEVADRMKPWPALVLALAVTYFLLAFVFGWR